MGDLYETSKKPASDARRPVGHLNWVIGFTPGSQGMFVRAAFSPVIRCFAMAGHDRVIITSSRVLPQTVFHDVQFRRAVNLEIGYSYYLDDYTFAFDADTELTTDVKMPVTISRANSEIVVARLAALPDEVAEAISQHAPLCEDVGFLVVRDINATIVIPCSEILRSCYAGNARALERYVRRTDRSKRLADGTTTLFNGFRFDGPKDSPYIFPMRVIRNLHRAENEIAQLLPRCLAFGQQYGQLPFLIRTPFVGQTLLHGDAIRSRHRQGDVLLFLRRVWFMAQKTWPHSRSAAGSFSPHIDEMSVSLPELGVSAKQANGKNVYYDVRRFPRHIYSLVCGIAGLGETHSELTDPLWSLTCYMDVEGRQLIAALFPALGNRNSRCDP